MGLGISIEIGMWGIGFVVLDRDLHWDGGCEVGVEVGVGI